MRASLQTWVYIFVLTTLSAYDWPRPEASESSIGLGPRQRLARVEALGDGDSAQAAIEGLRADDIPLRLASIRATARTHALDAIPTLRALATDTNATVRAAAITALGALLGEPPQTGVGAELFVRALGDTEPTVRVASLTAIERLNLQAAFANVLGQVDSDMPLVRASALRTASTLHPQGACLAAQSRITDEDPEVALAAIAALELCPASPSLANALAARLQTATDRVSEQAASALVHLEHPLAQELVRELLEATNTSPMVSRSLLAAQGYGSLENLAPALTAITQPQLAATAEGTLLRWISDHALRADSTGLLGLRDLLHQAMSERDSPASILPLARVLTELGYWVDLAPLEPVLERHAQSLGGSPELLAALANIRSESAALTVLRGLTAPAGVRGPPPRAPTPLDVTPTTGLSDSLMPNRAIALLIFLDRGWLDGRAVEPVEEIFKQLSDAQLQAIVLMVPSSAAPRLIPTLLARADDAPPTLRVALVRTAARLARAEDTRLLEPFLLDTSSAVRLEAALGIARYADHTFMDRARTTLSTGLAFDRGAFALASQGGLALTSPASKPQELPLDEALAFWTLTGLGHSSRVTDHELLERYTVTASTASLREAAIVALANVPQRSQRLLQLLNSSAPSVVASAALGLGALAPTLSNDDAAAVRDVLAGKIDSAWPAGPNVVAAWSKSIQLSSDAAANPQLGALACSLLRRRDPSVRTNAIYALAALRIADCAGVSADAISANARSMDVQTAAHYWARSLLSSGVVTPSSPRHKAMLRLLRRCAQTQPRVGVQTPTPSAARLLRCGIPRNESTRSNAASESPLRLPAQAPSHSAELAALRCPGEPTWIVRASAATHRITVPAAEGCVVDSAFVEPLEPSFRAALNTQ